MPVGGHQEDGLDSRAPCGHSCWPSGSRTRSPETARSPRMTSDAPTRAQNGSATPRTAPPGCARGPPAEKSAMSSLMMSMRSWSENSGPRPRRCAGPITSLSTSRSERRTTSMCPLVTGSNVPGYTPMRLYRHAPPPFLVRSLRRRSLSDTEPSLIHRLFELRRPGFGIRSTLPRNWHSELAVAISSPSSRHRSVQIRDRRTTRSPSATLNTRDALGLRARRCGCRAPDSGSAVPPSVTSTIWSVSSHREARRRPRRPCARFTSILRRPGRRGR